MPFSLTTSGSPTFSGSACTIDAGDRLQAPAALLDETQGWVAARVKMGAASGSDPHGGGNNLIVFEWCTASNNRIRLSYQPANNGADSEIWRVDRSTGSTAAGIKSAAQAFAAGTDFTIIFAWDATTIYMSIDGAAFVSAANTSIPNLAAATTWDIGSGGSVETSKEFMGDVHWMAGGKGALPSDADAATLHAFGNTDPAWSQLPVAGSFLWTADSADYETAFPNTSVLDNFDRADGDPGADWTADPDGAGYAEPTIESNELRANPGNAFSAAYWSAASFAANQEVYCTLAVAPAAAVRVYARIGGVGVLATVDNYELEVDNTSSYISKTVNGTRTFLLSCGELFGAGDQMGLACIGDQIIAYKNGVEIGRVTDTDVTAGGYIAVLYQNDSTARLDDFGGGSLLTDSVLEAEPGSYVLTGVGTGFEAPEYLPVVEVTREGWRLYVRRNSDLARLGEIDDYQLLKMVPRFNAPGAWELDLFADSDAAALITFGRGLLVTFNGEEFFSGPVTNLARRWSSDGNRLIVSGADDSVWLPRRLAYPEAPALTTATDAYDVRTGVASTVMTGYVDDNMGPSADSARRVPALVMGPDLAVGSTITGSARFQPMDELLRGLALAGGDLGFRIVQVDDTLEFQVYEPADHSADVIFSAALGNLAAYDYSEAGPVANFIIVGGGGEGELRQFVTGGDTPSINRYGRAEAFVDRRDSTDTTELEQARDETLSEDAERTSLSATPVDTEAFEFGTDYGLGDRVTVVVDGTAISDVVRELQITLTPDGGQFVTPVVGTPGERDPRVPGIFDRMNRLERQLRDLERKL